MQALRAVYEETCSAATIDPRQEFIDEIEACIKEGRATLDCRIDGGVTYHKLDDKDFSVILDTLKKGGCIHSICVPRNNLTDNILPGVALLIAQSDSITRVDFTGNQITADGVKALQEALVQSQSLTHVSFAQNEVGDEGCLQVVLALRNNRTITHLDLSDTGMSHNALTVLGSLVGQINRLRSLRIDNPHSGIDADSAAKRLFLSLAVNQSLAELSIARARLGDDSAFLLAEALAANTTLARLRLRANAISSVGAEHIAAALRRNARLEVLDLSGNAVGDKGAQALAATLAENAHLARLDLQSNAIHGVGLLALCRALPANTALAELALWGNCFVDGSVMDQWALFAEGPRAATLKLDFVVAYTTSHDVPPRPPAPYVARTAPVDSPRVWVSDA
jgi:Ran GTPase-activating protein (RanGAP) involved in mRNA processing and transport